MPYSAGDFKYLGEILRVTKTQDSTGQEIETYTTWRVVKMGKKDTRGEEVLRANQELAFQTTIWRMHFLDGLRYEDRIRVDDETYDIINIAEIGFRAGLEVTSKAARVT